MEVGTGSKRKQFEADEREQYLLAQLPKSMAEALKVFTIRTTREMNTLRTEHSPRLSKSEKDTKELHEQVQQIQRGKFTSGRSTAAPKGDSPPSANSGGEGRRATWTLSCANSRRETHRDAPLWKPRLGYQQSNLAFLKVSGATLVRSRRG
ncbi:unnamed protein product [Prorocentrum cordatum]|uniref:Uncharacterized protein n=1 Tax=Prorocentrum cordatum TaxID=2364126 RepID=A0ABN9VZU8_9DINO|nr:unnamed protein product [Polarella glacialis]